MHKRLSLISVIILSYFLIFFNYAQAEDHVKSIPLILDSAENFFIFLNERNYKAAWELLTKKSHQTIIDDIYRISAEKGVDIKKENISKYIHNNGILFNGYWDAFMANFDPVAVLNDRVWEFEKIETSHAVILLKKRSITKLHMYKEGNQWKVGLVETFWMRKYLNGIKRIQLLFAG